MSTSDDAYARNMYLAGADEPLLTFKEECSLGRLIQRGLRARKRFDEILDLERKLKRVIKKYAKEKEVLFKVVTEGVEAEQRLVERNRRLVVSVARKFVCNLSQEDLFHEGTIGLCNAAKGFDPYMGFRFGTYATYWIRQAIQRAIGNVGRTIRLPIHISAATRKCYAVKNRLTAELGRNPSLLELAGEMNLSLQEVEELEDINAETVLPDVLLDEGDEFSLLESLPDRHVEEKVSLEEAIELVIKNFKPREREVIRLRLGIGKESPVTLERAGSLLRITRERVRQIEKRALEKLRNNKTILAFKKCS